ncbi:hypothetical protein DVH05_014596 [Phytophthora capsici]|nr:hypothetical protein DVH05_014596 [Phytophthora capsici]
MKILLQLAAALSLTAAATPVEHTLDTTLGGTDINAIPVIKDAKWYWENDHVFNSENVDFFANFKPNDENQTCSSDRHATPFNRQVRGANLGGWLVLEPWITPTLFYQFLSTQERFGDLAPEKTRLSSGHRLPALVQLVPLRLSTGLCVRLDGLANSTRPRTRTRPSTTNT